MSDVLPLCPMHTYLQWKLSVESPSLAYASKSTTKTILFAVDIPFPLLRSWYNLVVLKKPFKTSCTCDPKKVGINLPSNFPQFTYIELFEFAIPGSSFGLTCDQLVRSEINNSLRVMAAKVYAEHGKSRGRKKQQLDSRTKRFHIFEGQTISVKQLKEKNQLAHDEMQKWKERNANIESEMKELYHQMEMALKERDEKIEKLETKNEELKQYVLLLEKSEKMKHQGKNITETKKKSRTLKKFLSRAKTALWFARSFGLELESVTVKEVNSGISHDLKMENNVTGTSNTDSSGFDALSENDKDKVEKVLVMCW